MDVVTHGEANEPAAAQSPTGTSQVRSAHSADGSSAQNCSIVYESSDVDSSAVLATIQEEAPTPSVGSPERAASPRAQKPCISPAYSNANDYSSQIPSRAFFPSSGPNTVNQSPGIARQKRSSGIKSHWPRPEEYSNAPASKGMPNPAARQHEWHYGTYSRAAPPRGHNSASNSRTQEGSGSSAIKRQLQGGPDVGLGLLGRQHLLALADKQLPELGVNNIKRENIRFEYGSSSSGSGSGSGSSQGALVGPFSGHGAEAAEATEQHAVHLDASQDVVQGYQEGVAAPAAPGESARDLTSRSRHAPVAAVAPRRHSVELTWLPVASRMEMVYAFPESKVLPTAPVSPLARPLPSKAATASISSDEESTFSTMVVASSATGRLATASECRDAFLRAGMAPPSTRRTQLHIKRDSNRLNAAHVGEQPLPPAMLAVTGNCASREQSVHSVESSERFFQAVGDNTQEPSSYGERHSSDQDYQTHGRDEVSLTAQIHSSTFPQIPLRSRNSSEDSGQLTPSSIHRESAHNTHSVMSSQPQPQVPSCSQQLSGEFPSQELEAVSQSLCFRDSDITQGGVDVQHIDAIPSGLKPIRLSRDTVAPAAASRVFAAALQQSIDTSRPSQRAPQDTSSSGVSNPLQPMGGDADMTDVDIIAQDVALTAPHAASLAADQTPQPSDQRGNTEMADVVMIPRDSQADQTPQQRMNPQFTANSLTDTKELPSDDSMYISEHSPQGKPYEAPTLLLTSQAATQHLTTSPTTRSSETLSRPDTFDNEHDVSGDQSYQHPSSEAVNKTRDQKYDCKVSGDQSNQYQQSEESAAHKKTSNHDKKTWLQESGAQVPQYPQSSDIASAQLHSAAYRDASPHQAASYVVTQSLQPSSVTLSAPAAVSQQLGLSVADPSVISDPSALAHSMAQAEPMAPSNTMALVSAQQLNMSVADPSVMGDPSVGVHSMAQPEPPRSAQQQGLSVAGPSVISNPSALVHSMVQADSMAPASYQQLSMSVADPMPGPELVALPDSMVRGDPIALSHATSPIDPMSIDDPNAPLAHSITQPDTSAIDEEPMVLAEPPNASETGAQAPESGAGSISGADPGETRSPEAEVHLKLESPRVETDTHEEIPQSQGLRVLQTDSGSETSGPSNSAQVPVGSAADAVGPIDPFTVQGAQNDDLIEAQDSHLSEAHSPIPNRTDSSTRAAQSSSAEIEGEEAVHHALGDSVGQVYDQVRVHATSTDSTMRHRDIDSIQQPVLPVENLQEVLHDHVQASAEEIRSSQVQSRVREEPSGDHNDDQHDDERLEGAHVQSSLTTEHTDTHSFILGASSEQQKPESFHRSRDLQKDGDEPLQAAQRVADLQCEPASTLTAPAAPEQAGLLAASQQLVDLQCRTPTQCLSLESWPDTNPAPEPHHTATATGALESDALPHPSTARAIESTHSMRNMHSMPEITPTSHQDPEFSSPVLSVHHTPQRPMSSRGVTARNSSSSSEAHSYSYSSQMSTKNASVAPWEASPSPGYSPVLPVAAEDEAEGPFGTVASPQEVDDLAVQGGHAAISDRTVMAGAEQIRQDASAPSDASAQSISGAVEQTETSVQRFSELFLSQSSSRNDDAVGSFCPHTTPDLPHAATGELDITGPDIQSPLQALHDPNARTYPSASAVLRPEHSVEGTDDQNLLEPSAAQPKSDFSDINNTNDVSGTLQCASASTALEALPELEAQSSSIQASATDARGVTWGAAATYIPEDHTPTGISGALALCNAASSGSIGISNNLTMDSTSGRCSLFGTAFSEASRWSLEGSDSSQSYLGTQRTLEGTQGLVSDLSQGREGSMQDSGTLTGRNRPRRLREKWQGAPVHAEMQEELCAESSSESTAAVPGWSALGQQSMLDHWDKPAEAPEALLTPNAEPGSEDYGQFHAAQQQQRRSHSIAPSAGSHATTSGQEAHGQQFSMLDPSMDAAQAHSNAHFESMNGTDKVNFQRADNVEDLASSEPQTFDTEAIAMEQHSRKSPESAADNLRDLLNDNDHLLVGQEELSETLETSPISATRAQSLHLSASRSEAPQGLDTMTMSPTHAQVHFGNLPSDHSPLADASQGGEASRGVDTMAMSTTHAQMAQESVSPGYSAVPDPQKKAATKLSETHTQVLPSEDSVVSHLQLNQERKDKDIVDSPLASPSPAQSLETRRLPTALQHSQASQEHPMSSTINSASGPLMMPEATPSDAQTLVVDPEPVPGSPKSGPSPQTLKALDSTSLSAKDVYQDTSALEDIGSSMKPGNEGVLSSPQDERSRVSEPHVSLQDARASDLLHLQPENEIYDTVDRHLEGWEAAQCMSESTNWSPRTPTVDLSNCARNDASHELVATTGELTHTGSLPGTYADSCDMEMSPDAHLYYRISVSTCATSEATSISSLCTSGGMWSTQQTELIAAGSTPYENKSSDASPSAERASLGEPVDMQPSAMTTRSCESLEGRINSKNIEEEEICHVSGTEAVPDSSGRCSHDNLEQKDLALEPAGSTADVSGAQYHESLARTYVTSCHSKSPCYSETYSSDHDDSMSPGARVNTHVRKSPQLTADSKAQNRDIGNDQGPCDDDLKAHAPGTAAPVLEQMSNNGPESSSINAPADHEQHASDSDNASLSHQIASKDQNPAVSAWDAQSQEQHGSENGPSSNTDDLVATWREATNSSGLSVIPEDLSQSSGRHGGSSGLGSGAGAVPGAGAGAGTRSGAGSAPGSGAESVSDRQPLNARVSRGNSNPQSSIGSLHSDNIDHSLQQYQSSAYCSTGLSEQLLLERGASGGPRESKKRSISGSIEPEMHSRQAVPAADVCRNESTQDLERLDVLQDVEEGFAWPTLQSENAVANPSFRYAGQEEGISSQIMRVDDHTASASTSPIQGSARFEPEMHSNHDVPATEVYRADTTRSLDMIQDVEEGFAWPTLQSEHAVANPSFRYAGPDEGISAQIMRVDDHTASVSTSSIQGSARFEPQMHSRHAVSATEVRDAETSEDLERLDVLQDVEEGFAWPTPQSENAVPNPSFRCAGQDEGISAQIMRSSSMSTIQGSAQAVWSQHVEENIDSSAMDATFNSHTTMSREDSSTGPIFSALEASQTRKRAKSRQDLLESQFTDSVPNLSNSYMPSSPLATTRTHNAPDLDATDRNTAAKDPNTPALDLDAAATDRNAATSSSLKESDVPSATEDPALASFQTDAAAPQPCNDATDANTEAHGQGPTNTPSTYSAYLNSSVPHEVPGAPECEAAVQKAPDVQLHSSQGTTTRRNWELRRKSLQSTTASGELLPGEIPASEPDTGAESSLPAVEQQSAAPEQITAHSADERSRSELHAVGLETPETAGVAPNRPTVNQDSFPQSASPAAQHKAPHDATPEDTADQNSDFGSINPLEQHTAAQNSGPQSTAPPEQPAANQDSFPESTAPPDQHTAAQDSVSHSTAPPEQPTATQDSNPETTTPPEQPAATQDAAAEATATPPEHHTTNQDSQPAGAALQRSEQSTAAQGLRPSEQPALAQDSPPTPKQDSQPASAALPPAEQPAANQDSYLEFLMEMSGAGTIEELEERSTDVSDYHTDSSSPSGTAPNDHKHPWQLLSVDCTSQEASIPGLHGSRVVLHSPESTSLSPPMVLPKQFRPPKPRTPSVSSLSSPTDSAAVSPSHSPTRARASPSSSHPVCDSNRDSHRELSSHREHELTSSNCASVREESSSTSQLFPAQNPGPLHDLRLSPRALSSSHSGARSLASEFPVAAGNSAGLFTAQSAADVALHSTGASSARPVEHSNQSTSPLPSAADPDGATLRSSSPYEEHQDQAASHTSLSAVPDEPSGIEPTAYGSCSASRNASEADAPYDLRSSAPNETSREPLHGQVSPYCGVSVTQDVTEAGPLDFDDVRSSSVTELPPADELSAVDLVPCGSSSASMQQVDEASAADADPCGSASASMQLSDGAQPSGSFVGDSDAVLFEVTGTFLGLQEELNSRNSSLMEASSAVALPQLSECGNSIEGASAAAAAAAVIPQLSESGNSIEGGSAAAAPGGAVGGASMLPQLHDAYINGAESRATTTPALGSASPTSTTSPPLGATSPALGNTTISTAAANRPPLQGGPNAGLGAASPKLDAASSSSSCSPAPESAGAVWNVSGSPGVHSISHSLRSNTPGCGRKAAPPPRPPIWTPPRSNEPLNSATAQIGGSAVSASATGDCPASAAASGQSAYSSPSSLSSVNLDGASYHTSSQSQSQTSDEGKEEEFGEERFGVQKKSKSASCASTDIPEYEKLWDSPFQVPVDTQQPADVQQLPPITPTMDTTCLITPTVGLPDTGATSAVQGTGFTKSVGAACTIGSETGLGLTSEVTGDAACLISPTMESEAATAAVGGGEIEHRGMEDNNTFAPSSGCSSRQFDTLAQDIGVGGNPAWSTRHHADGQDTFGHNLPEVGSQNTHSSKRNVNGSVAQAQHSNLSEHRVRGREEGSEEASSHGEASVRPREGQKNLNISVDGALARSTVFVPGVLPTEMQVLYGSDRERAHSLAVQKLEHSEVMAALQASAVQDGESFVVAIQSGGLSAADVSLSTEEGAKDARILVHMRAPARLLQALNAQPSQVVDSRMHLTADKHYRVTVSLPHAVVGLRDMQPEPIDTFFTWRVPFLQ